jgi:hypothetical protein
VSLNSRCAQNCFWQWQLYLSGDGSLLVSAEVMGSIITDEHPASRAIMIEGVGAQLRIYCRYGMPNFANRAREGAGV